MEVFQAEIQDLLNHCQKTDIDFNMVYKNAMLALNSQDNTNGKLQQKKPISIEQVKSLLTSWTCIIVFSALMTLLLTYWQLELLTTHATAIGRIIMIQALPFYDWRSLKRERCLIKKSALFTSDSKAKPGFTESDCNYCDGINSVSVLKYPDQAWSVEDTTREDLISNLADQVKSYYDIDAPIIISNTSGPILDIEDVMNDREYVEYVPCDVQSNVYIRESSTVEDIFMKLHKAPFYFAHWRNCNQYAMKMFRRFFARPQYLHVNFSPIQQSWVIINKNYYSANQNYQQLILTDRLALVAVVKGHLKARLTPTRYCYVGKMCNDIIIDLYRADALIFSDRWEIDYLLSNDERDGKQDPEGVNMAIVLETH